MKTVILAGGSGTRLWPLSREAYPKQFLKFQDLDNKSLFQLSYLRARKISQPEDILIVTNQEHKFLVMGEIKELKEILIEDNILCEPIGKNTLPAIAWAMSKCKPEEDAIILSSDHFIQNEEVLLNALPKAQELSKDSLILFGCKPTSPHTGYGYIKFENNSVLEFKEKPFEKIAEQYLRDGNYLWNLGIFYFNQKVFMEELKINSPDLFSKLPSLPSEYHHLESASIDIGLSEKTNKLGVISLELDWSDLGSFDSIYDAFAKDEDKNHKSSRVKYTHSHNNYVMTTVPDKIVACVGVDNIVAVDTEDALLLCPRNLTQHTKIIVNQLKEEKDYRLEIHKTAYRPWGSYTILEDKPNFKVKRLTVFPGKLLSLQSHKRRSEHWTIVKGQAYIINGEEELILNSNESTYIPQGNKHRLGNKTDQILEVIEVQCGDYFGEDDIERYEDKYNRT